MPLVYRTRASRMGQTETIYGGTEHAGASSRGARGQLAAGGVLAPRRECAETAPAAHAQSGDRRDRATSPLQPGRRERAAVAVGRVPRAHSRLRCGPLRDARIQPLDSGRAEECDRRRLAPVRQERMGRQAVRRRQQLAWRDRRFRRPASPAPVPGLPRHAGHAAAGDVLRRRGQAGRRRGPRAERQDA